MEVRECGLLREYIIFCTLLFFVMWQNRVMKEKSELELILGRNVRVTSVKGQSELKNPIVGGRNIRLDIEAENENGEKFNTEVQRSNSGAHVRQARFHSSMVDSKMLKEKQNFKEIKDFYVIFITEKDFFKKGKPIYHVKRIIKEIDEDFEDGSNIIYVNGAYQGDDDIGRLMHDFHCKRADDIFNSTLAGSVRHFKEEGGRAEMCEAVQKYADEKEMRGEERGEKFLCTRSSKRLETGHFSDAAVLILSLFQTV